MAFFSKKPAATSSATTAKMPIKKPVSGAVISKSERLQSASARAQTMKAAAATSRRTMPTQRIMPSQRLTPKANTDVATAVVTTEHKVRASTPNKQLGQLLLKAGKISDAQLDAALAQQSSNGGLLGQILVAAGACNLDDVGGVLKQQRTITTVNLAVTNVDLEVVKLLERSFCAKNRVFPFEICGGQLCVAMSNALDTTTKNDVKEKTGQSLKIFDASNSDIQAAIKKHFTDAAPVAAKPSLAEEAKKEEITGAQEGANSDIVVELPPEDETTAAEISETVETVNEVKGGDMPSIAKNLEDLDIEAARAAINATTGAATSATSALFAIPLTADYAKKLFTAEGVFSAEKRWLAAINASTPIPAFPLFSKIA